MLYLKKWIIKQENRLKIWLGNLKSELELKKEFETQNGIREFVQVFMPNSHIQLNWKPKTWENISIENENKMTIHQEKILNSEE